jgi:DNA modification methylase
MKELKPYYEDDYAVVYHGDSISVMRQLEGESIDAIWTDPPYGHGNHDGDLNARLNDHRGLENKPIANDTQEEFRETLNLVLIEAARVLKQDCCCCCCCCCGGGGPRPTFAWVADRMDRHGLQFFHSVIWDKRNPGLGWRFRRQHEMVMVAHRKGGKLLWADDKTAVPNIISLMPPRDRQHPNEKPLPLVSLFLAWHLMPDSVVLDPFMGSGTTLVAAKQLGRRAIGIEIEEKYCEIAATRLRNEPNPLFSEPPPKMREQELL